MLFMRSERRCGLLTLESGLEIGKTAGNRCSPEKFSSNKFCRPRDSEMKLLKVSQCHEDSPDFRSRLAQLEVGTPSSHIAEFKS